MFLCSYCSRGGFARACDLQTGLRVHSGWRQLRSRRSPCVGGRLDACPGLSTPLPSRLLKLILLIPQTMPRTRYPELAGDSGLDPFLRIIFSVELTAGVSHNFRNSVPILIFIQKSVWLVIESQILRTRYTDIFSAFCAFVSFW